MLTGLVAVSILSASVAIADNGRTAVFRQARNLYDNGMYERARTLFESISGDPLAEGYAVLCALKMQTADAADALEAYQEGGKSSSVSSQVVFQDALNLFDAHEYSKAAAQLSRIGAGDLRPGQRAEYVFKRGYCDYVDGAYEDAKTKFFRLQKMPKSDYTAPAHYLTGLMDYTRRNFKDAEESFRLAAGDPRFAEMSEFYLVDCEFNEKNYDYVIEHGEAIFDSAPAERQERLARIISESYLVRGDKQKASDFYFKSSTENLTRADLFYAGTVLYGVDDFQGAIDNYTRMPERTDSVGQIANYHLGNAYLKMRNQVAAMYSFKDAAAADYDSKMTEDALFNYAKLAFDLNKDTSGFADYIKRYSTTRRGESIYGYMALAALYDRDYARAVDAYDNIEELSPDMLNNYTKANYLRARQLVQRGSYSDAVPCLRATAYYLPKTDRLNQLARYWLAESYYNTEKYADAARIYEDLYNASALDSEREGALAPYNAAYCRLKQDDYDAAAKWFDVYLNGGDRLQREDALERRGDCDFARRRYKDAIAAYQKCQDEYGNVNTIYPYYRQAIATGLAGDKKMKAEILSKVEKASPSAPLFNEAMYELGRAYMDVKNNGAAVRTFLTLRSATSDKAYAAKALIGLGMVNRNLGEYEKALGYYKEVVSSMPDSEYSEDALLAIESIYQTCRTPEKYLEYVEQNSLAASKSEEEKEQMYFNTAEQVYLAGNWPEAVTSLQKYLDSYPNGSKVLDATFYMADSYRSMGSKEKACDLFRKVAATNGASPFVETSKLQFAEISYGLGRYEDAYKGYSDLLSSARMEDNQALARKGMMRSAFRARDFENAVSASAAVASDVRSSTALRREAAYVQAKSYLSMSRRAEAMALFETLSAEPSTAEGAEAKYILIQDTFDKGEFDKVEKAVYAFSGSAGSQSYWLAKAYLVLGDSFMERGMKDQARATYESIRDGYQASRPDDDIKDNVKMRLEHLQTL